MTLLQVMADTDADEVRMRTDDARLIGDELATRGIVFDRRPIASDVDASGPGDSPVLARFQRNETRLSAPPRDMKPRFHVPEQAGDCGQHAHRPFG